MRELSLFIYLGVLLLLIWFISCAEKKNDYPACQITLRDKNLIAYRIACECNQRSLKNKDKTLNELCKRTYKEIVHEQNRIYFGYVQDGTTYQNKMISYYAQIDSGILNNKPQRYLLLGDTMHTQFQDSSFSLVLVLNPINKSLLNYYKLNQPIKVSVYLDGIEHIYKDSVSTIIYHGHIYQLDEI